MKRRDFLLAAVAALGIPLLPARQPKPLTQADIERVLRGVYESYRVTVFPKLPFTVKAEGGWREQRFDAAPARYLRR